MIYFDNSATTPPAPEVVDTITEYMKRSFGNPSSRHALGLEAEKLVTESRKSVAAALDERERDIIVKRYGLDGGRPLTQREVAKKLNISRSYV